ncbi:hypothetical protein AB0C33_46505 [Nonomuraea sp. NPDC048881]|uniref:hypothetical protein n=1 Tax=Nonomuraea sp. NPDC048881 TaxID=3155030 RepID=UPI0033D866A9
MGEFMRGIGIPASTVLMPASGENLVHEGWELPIPIAKHKARPTARIVQIHHQIPDRLDKPARAWMSGGTQHTDTPGGMLDDRQDVLALPVQVMVSRSEARFRTVSSGCAARWAEVFHVTPATILRWRRNLVARKWTFTDRRRPRRPGTHQLAHTDLKVVKAMLGHASIVLTADTYVSVLPEAAHEAARETARLVLNAASALGRQLGG